MLLKIALNGARPKAENEYLPHSLTEIEKEVTLLFQNGCKVFHIHCYGADGTESLKPEDVDNLVLKVKNISANIQIGISQVTGLSLTWRKELAILRSGNTCPISHL